MQPFIKRLSIFLLPLLAICALGLLLPTTPRASKSLLFSIRQKNELLRQTPSPRMIFVGGSNLSFGLNSRLIRDELRVNPVNTGVHAGLGLKYMLDSTIGYVREGDVVILIPEYNHFFRSYAQVSEELFRVVFDVDISHIRFLSVCQMFDLLPFIPEYAVTKLKPDEYFNVKESDVYGVDCFNQFGDTDAHWHMRRRDYPPITELGGTFNPVVMAGIIDFKRKVEKKRATLFVGYPGYQDLSFDNAKADIALVAREFERNGLATLGDPKRYAIANHLTFNTPYHLNKAGVDHRTRLLIADYRRKMSDTGFFRKKTTIR